MQIGTKQQQQKSPNYKKFSNISEKKNSLTRITQNR